MPEPTVEILQIQVAAKYLRDILDDLERARNRIECDDEPEPSISEVLHRRDHGDHESSITSTYETVSCFSRALSETASTVFSEDVSEVEIVQNVTLSYSLNECFALFRQMLNQVTYDQLLIVHEDWDLTALIAALNPEEVFLLRCLKICFVTGMMHKYEQDRRCVGCNEQLCRECQNCIINSDFCRNTWENDIGVRSDQRDSLAVRRVHSPCNPDHWNKIPQRLRVLRKTLLCTCTEFLMEYTHSCEKGNGHFCKTCFETALNKLQVPNTRKITVKFQGVRETLIQYTRDNGEAVDPKYQRYCKLCYLPCRPPILNPPNSIHKVNGNDEGQLGKWNNGKCVFYLEPLESDTEKKRLSCDLMRKMRRGISQVASRFPRFRELPNGE